MTLIQEPGSPRRRHVGTADFASDSNNGPGTTSPESRDIFAMPDGMCNFDPGPGVPSAESGLVASKCRTA